MSAEEHQAEQLAQWLASPTEGPPPDLDADVLEGLYALRPDLAPSPRLRAEDILADLLEGPLALPATDLLAATAMADWLDSGGSAPDVLDDDVIEGITALRPELAAPPSLTADDILADLADPGAVTVQAAETTAAPANNHRWFLLGAAGGSGLLAVAAAALFTLTVNLQGGNEASFAAADPTADEAEEVKQRVRAAPQTERQAATSDDRATATSSPKPLTAEGGETRLLKDAAEKEGEASLPAGQATPAPQATPPREDIADIGGLIVPSTTRAGGSELSNTPTNREVAGEVGELSMGMGDAGETGASSTASAYGRSEQPSAPPPAVAKPRPRSPASAPSRAAKRDALQERWSPPAAPPSGGTTRAPEAPAPAVAEAPDEPAIADLEDDFAAGEESEFAYETYDADMPMADEASKSEDRVTEEVMATGGRDRLAVRRSKSASNMAEQDLQSWGGDTEAAGPAAEPQPAVTDTTSILTPADQSLRQAAASGVGPITRRAGFEAGITPPQAQGEPVAIHLVEAAIARQDYASAQSLARSGLSLGGTNTPERAWLYVLDGDAAAAQGDAAGAERSWREAIRLNKTRTAAPSTEADRLMSDPD